MPLNIKLDFTTDGNIGAWVRRYDSANWGNAQVSSTTTKKTLQLLAKKIGDLKIVEK